MGLGGMRSGGDILAGLRSRASPSAFTFSVPRASERLPLFLGAMMDLGHGCIRPECARNILNAILRALKILTLPSSTSSRYLGT